MFSVIASQAIALTQSKNPTQSKKKPGCADAAAVAVPQKRALRRVFQAIAEARLRRAEIELRQHRQLHGV